MTHRGPFQPRPFCDSVTILAKSHHCEHLGGPSTMLLALLEAEAT